MKTQANVLERTNQTAAGKPVFEREAKTVLAYSEAFAEKLLCTGPVLNLGDACMYSCSYCYVKAMMHKLLHHSLKEQGRDHAEVVVRRKNALNLLVDTLHKSNSKLNPYTKHTVFTSTTVDPMPTIEMMGETAEACLTIFVSTAWDIRILTKSNLLPKFVKLIPEEYHHRLVMGVSTGTLSNEVAKAVEVGTPLVTKRLQALHWLQDNGFRTFGMICPSLPQLDYDKFSRDICEAIRVDRCEHVWAEPINLRGDSFTRTIAALKGAGLNLAAGLLGEVCGTGSKQAWEEYAQATFLAHTKNIPPKKLRFLHYPNRAAESWWKKQVSNGAVLLGKHA